MNLFQIIFFTSLLLLASCNQSMPTWLKESNHSISPDGNAAIYSYNLDNNRISVSTWINSTISSGGCGFFDIETYNNSGVKLSWISESNAQIEYPADAKILKQEDSCFFAGRIIKFYYKVKTVN
jgi:hypothetical protein